MAISAFKLRASSSSSVQRACTIVSCRATCVGLQFTA
jgi:hypothetical protein